MSDQEIEDEVDKNFSLNEWTSEKKKNQNIIRQNMSEPNLNNHYLNDANQFQLKNDTLQGNFSFSSSSSAADVAADHQQLIDQPFPPPIIISTTKLQPSISSTSFSPSFPYFLCLLYAFLEMGFSTGLLGPSILSLGALTNSTLSVLSWVFASRSLGLFAGTMIAGKLIDLYPNRGRFILFCGSTFLAVFCCIIPFQTNIVALIFFSICHGTAFGFVDNTSQVLLIREYQAKVGPYMQALHCAFGVGAFFGPLILSPFLSSSSTVDPTSISIAGGSDSNIDANQLISDDTTFRIGWVITAVTGIPGILWILFYTLRDEFGVETHNFEYYFHRLIGKGKQAEELRRRWIILKEQQLSDKDINSTASTKSLELEEQENEDENDTSEIEYDNDNGNDDINISERVCHPLDAGVNDNSWHEARHSVSSPAFSSSTLSSEDRAELYFQYRVVICVGIFLTLYVGCESGYGSYIYSYAVKKLNMSVDDSAYLNSSYWGSFAIGRFIGIFVSLYWTPAQMVIVDLSGCMIAVIIILIFNNSISVIWFSTILYGISVGSIYASAINYTEHLLSVNGTLLSYLTFFAAFGDASVPLVMGALFTTSAGPIGMMWTALAVAMSATSVFIILIRVVGKENRGKNKGREDQRLELERQNSQIVELENISSPSAHNEDN